MNQNKDILWQVCAERDSIGMASFYGYRDLFGVQCAYFLTAAHLLVGGEEAEIGDRADFEKAQLRILDLNLRAIIADPEKPVKKLDNHYQITHCIYPEIAVDAALLAVDIEGLNSDDLLKQLNSPQIGKCTSSGSYDAKVLREEVPARVAITFPNSPEPSGKGHAFLGGKYDNADRGRSTPMAEGDSGAAFWENGYKTLIGIHASEAIQEERDYEAIHIVPAHKIKKAFPQFDLVDDYVESCEGEFVISGTETNLFKCYQESLYGIDMLNFRDDLVTLIRAVSDWISPLANAKNDLNNNENIDFFVELKAKMKFQIRETVTSDFELLEKVYNKTRKIIEGDSYANLAIRKSLEEFAAASGEVNASDHFDKAQKLYGDLDKFKDRLDICEEELSKEESYVNQAALTLDESYRGNLDTHALIKCMPHTEKSDTYPFHIYRACRCDAI